MTETTQHSDRYSNRLAELIEQLDDTIPSKQMAMFNHDARKLAESYPSPLKRLAGDKASMFTLPDASGQTISLAALLTKGPVVLTFYRGIWCPYCNLQLKMYQDILPQIKKTGASLVAVSPMTSDNSLAMQQQNDLQFYMLSDSGNQVSQEYTSVFENDSAPVRAMEDLGFDFYSFNVDNNGELPVPATFVIREDGIIVFAGSEGGDYRYRIEPDTILDALDTLTCKECHCA